MTTTHSIQCLTRCALTLALLALLPACAGTRKSTDGKATQIGGTSGTSQTAAVAPQQGTAVQVGLFDNFATLFAPEVPPVDKSKPLTPIGHPVGDLVKNGRLVQTLPDNQLQFEPLNARTDRPVPGMLEDAAIASKTRGRFAARQGLGRDRIKVTCDRGVVTLDGVVEDQVTAARAVDLALEVPDVVLVYSKIRVIPPDPSNRG